MKYAFFVISGNQYAAPMEHFRELREPSEMRELPEPHPPFIGWAMDQDTLCPVVDLSLILGGVRPNRPMWLVIADDDKSICVVIDGPAVWQSVDESRLLRKTNARDAFPQDYLMGMIAGSGKAPASPIPPIPIVDLKKFLSAGDAKWMRDQVAPHLPEAPLP
jgi:chemotaxis signal transduction protein